MANKHGKRYRALAEKIDARQLYTLNEAVATGQRHCQREVR